MHVVDYDDADVLDVAGVPVLTRARLVLDCCDVLPPDSALAVADAALARDLTTVHRARRRATTPPDPVTNRRSGRRAGRRTGPIRSPRTGSSRAHDGGCWKQGCPDPDCRCRSATSEVASRTVDMLIGRVVGEADGAVKYDDPGALFAEKHREDWLRDVHRVEVVRWVPAEMRSRSGRRRGRRTVRARSGPRELIVRPLPGPTHGAFPVPHDHRAPRSEPLRPAISSRHELIRCLAGQPIRRQLTPADPPDPGTITGGPAPIRPARSSPAPTRTRRRARRRASPTPPAPPPPAAPAGPPRRTRRRRSRRRAAGRPC